MKTGNKVGLFQKLALAAFAFVLLTDLSATPVSTNLAGMAALTWLQTGNRLGMGVRSDVGSVKAFSTESGAAFNVVYLQNGGFVVTSNDTDIEPIIAFSGTSDFVENPQSPLWVMLDKDLAARARKCKIAAKAPSARAVPLSAPAAQWARLTRGASLGTELRQDVDYAPSADGMISDVRVEPLLETKWSQEEPCYNFYTPSNYPCGCVATATAQIMRYFRYPTGSVTPRTNTCEIQSGTQELGDGYYEVLYSPISLTMQGGIYDWNNMPAVPDSEISDVQRKAIGKLTSDIGIACFMSYAEGASGTGGYVAGPALTDVFGYANALPIVAPGGSGGYFTSETIRQVLISNLDAKLPVLTSLDGPSGGHGAVADGYGYSSGTFYVHFNMGWGGWGDSWYAPPVVDEFTAIDTFVYNIYPDGKKGGVICSGRVTTSSGLPIVGVKVSVPDPSQHKRGECTTDENGVYALILSEGTYDVTASSAKGDSVQPVTLKACKGTRVVMDVAYDPDHPGTVNNVYGFDFTLETDDTAVAVVGFNANGGSVSPESRSVVSGAVVGSLPIPVRDGYAFDGWFTAASGGTQVTASAVVTGNVTYYAHWTKLPDWFTSKDEAMAEARRTGKKVFLLSGRDSCYNTMLTREACSDPTVMAKLDEKCVLWYSDCDTQFAETFMYTIELGEYTLPIVCVIDPDDPDNYLKQWSSGYMDEAQIIDFVADVPAPTPPSWTVSFDARGGNVSPASRSVVSGSAIGTLPVPTRFGYAFDGWFTEASGGTQVTAATVVTANVTFYAHWTKETTPVPPGPDGECYDHLDVSDVVAAYSVPKTVTLLGAVYDGCDVVGIVELKLGKVNGKKGTGKVSGSVTTLDGMKHTMKAFTLTGIDGTAPKAASLEVKDLGTMAITIGGTQFAGALGRYHVQSAGVGGNWTRTDARVYVDATRASLPSGTLENCLPAGEPVIAAAGKWKFAKAANVKWAKPKKGAATPEIYDEASGKGLVVDMAGDKTNLSGLKITYTPKKGTFKGSFKLYVLEGAGSATKLKKYIVKVSGVVVDGVGYGTATCRNPALAWTVTVK